MKKTIIVGAGLAGLSTAYHLNRHDYEIFEADEQVGGLCKSIKHEGFTFDYTGHFLHFRQDPIKKLVFKLLGKNLEVHKRKSGIYLYGVTTPYPFQLNTYGHSAEVRMECLLGLIEAKYASNGYEIKTFKDWILRTCGEGVAKHFMFPYNRKIWTVDPEEMTTDWLSDFIPTPNIEGALLGAMKAPDSEIGYNAQFYYPREGGISALPESFVPHIRNLHLNSRIQWIDLKDKRVGIGNQAYKYDFLVSTIPLKSLLLLIRNLDPAIKTMADRLRNTSVCCVNLGVRRDHITDYHWLYFPEEKYIFYRVGLPSQLNPNMAPQGMSSISVEISYSPWKPLADNIVERVIADLKKTSLLRENDEIVTTKIVDIPCAYVIYDSAREKILETVRAYLKAHQVLTIGRFGNWEYAAMEDAIRNGLDAATELNYHVS